MDPDGPTTPAPVVRADRILAPREGSSARLAHVPAPPGSAPSALLASTGGPRAATAGPTVVGGSLHTLHVVLWDLHAARSLDRRLRAAGVPASDIVLRGRRRDGGPQEADVKPLRRLGTRWRTNLLVAAVGSVMLGLPVGAAAGAVLSGDQEPVAIAAGVVGAVGLLLLSVLTVWADLLQRREGSRQPSRLEGHLTIRGDVAVVRAEMLLTATDDVLEVRRAPRPARGGDLGTGR